MSSPHHWITIAGKIAVSGDTFTYKPDLATDGPSAGIPNVTVLKSDAQFQAGEIRCEVKASGPKTSMQIVLSHDRPSQVFCGLGVFGAPYGLQIFRNNKFEMLSIAGTQGDLPCRRWLSIRLLVTGSRIDLFIDGVQVCSYIHTIEKSQVALFVQAFTPVQIRRVEIRPDKPRAFVVMQFSDPFNALYREVIEPTCRRFGFDVLRADDIYASGTIIEDISRQIQESSFIIADVTVDNPNVFYEVGYAHGIRKPTILLAEKQRIRLPFDVSGFRTLFYENSIGGKAEVEALTQYLQSMAV